jgi:hypothetical protein
MKVSSSQSHTLLIVETETNGESKVLPWWVFWAYCASARDFCPALSGTAGLVQNIFFLTVRFFNSFVPIAQQTGQAVLLGRVSLNMSLWLHQALN